MAAIAYLIWALPRVCIFIFLVIMLVWTIQVEGSLGFDLNSTFGWHSIFMTLAGPVFMTEAVLAFTSPFIDPKLFTLDRSKRRSILEHIHAFLHVASLFCGVVALVGIAYYKKLNEVGSGSGSDLQLGGNFELDGFTFPFFTMFSPHSWAGVATISLWGIQLLVRLCTYVRNDWNSGLARWHGFFGKVVYVSTLATCAIGLNDMQSSDLGGKDGMQYPPFSANSLMSSGMALVLIFLGIAVFAVPGLKKDYVKSSDDDKIEQVELNQKPSV